MATTKVIVMMEFNASSLERLPRFGCGVFLDFLSASDRNKLLSVSGAGLTIAGLKVLYPTHVDEIDAEALNGTQRTMSLTATPLIPGWYVGSFDVSAVQWGRIQGWLATATDLWIRIELGALEILDEWGDDITGMPPEGTDIATIGGLFDLLALSGFVPTISGEGGGGGFTPPGGKK